MCSVRSVAVANPAAMAAKPSVIAKPNARRRATNATMTPASAALDAAHQAGSRSAVKYATMPKPKATGSQGSSRPGATSATAHCESSRPSQAARSASPAGSMNPARRRAASISAAQALARVRRCSFSAMARRPRRSRNLTLCYLSYRL